MQPSTLAKRVSSLLLLAFSAFYFYGLGRLPLVGPDEPRYAQVAREMLMRGDLLTPTLNGHPWFEKPVLLYWLMIVGYKIFGVTELAARLGSAIAGVLTIAATYWFARTIECTSDHDELEGFGLWSGIVTATTLGLIVFSRGASFDVLVTASTTWALLFFLLYDLKPNHRRRALYLVGFYSLIGVSLLAKGLVGFLALGIIGFYFLLRRTRPERWLIASLAWGLPLSFAVAAIWYGPVIVRHGWSFINEFIIQHHFARYLSNKYHHPQPISFYLLIMVPLTLPWTAFFLNGLATLRAFTWRSDKPIEKMRVLSVAWLLLPILAFSFSKSKLPGYIIPVLPAAALLAAERLSHFVSTGVIGRGAMRATGLISLLFAVGGLFYAKRSNALLLQCAIAIVLPLIIAGLFAVVRTDWRMTSAVLVASATVISLIIVLSCGSDRLAQRDSVKELIQLADARGYANAPICSLHAVEHTAQFYASGRLIYGPDNEPMKFEGPTEVLEVLKKNTGGVLVLVPLEYVTQLTSLKSAKAEVIGNNGVLAIVAVHLSVSFSV